MPLRLKAHRRNSRILPHTRVTVRQLPKACQRSDTEIRRDYAFACQALALRLQDHVPSGAGAGTGSPDKLRKPTSTER